MLLFRTVILNIIRLKTKYAKIRASVTKLNALKYASARKLGTQRSITIGNMKITIAVQYSDYRSKF